MYPYFLLELTSVICLYFVAPTFSTSTGVLGSVYPLLMGAILGIGDGVLNTQLSALLGLLFKNDKVGTSMTNIDI